MKQRFSTLAVLLSGILIILSSCREDTIIKSSLTPAVDNINTFGIGPDFNNGTDTITMLTSTAFQDSIVTSTRNTGFPIFHTIAWMQDPFAGTTDARVYAQFVPTAVNVKLDTIPDSVVLVVPYAGFTWGDTTVRSEHTYNVYALNEGFSKDSAFYSYSSKSVNPTVIGTATIITGPSSAGVRIQDSTIPLGKSQKRRTPHLRIKLSENWITGSFLPAVADDATYEAYLAKFPGLCIAPAADTGNRHPGTYTLPYFRLNGSASVYGSAALLAYMRGNDSTPVQFPYLESQAAHFNRIRRNYSGFPIASLSPEYLVMQNAPGATIDLQLPNIHNLFRNSPQKGIINKAEITFTVVTAPGQSAADDAKFFGPVRLYPQGINSSGGQYTIADRYPINDQSLSFIDGTASTVTKNGRTMTVYRLNIPREVQQAIVANNGGLHLRIGGTVNYPAAYRLVVAGRGNSDASLRPTINIIYSKQ